MKRLLYITILLGVILMSAVSSFKWKQISDVTTTLTEINYIHGLTSAIQAQLNAKPDTSDVISATEADAKYLQLTDTIPFSSIAYNKRETEILNRHGSDSLWFNTSNHKLYAKTLRRTYTYAAIDSAVNTNWSGLKTKLYAGYYLDEASGALVDILSTNIGSNHGAVANQAGKIGTAYNFDTATDYLLFHYTTIPASENRVIAMWINLDVLPSVAGRTYTLADEMTSAYASKFNLYVTTGNNISATSTDTSGSSKGVSTTGGLISATGTWYHVIYVMPTATVTSKLYINGINRTNGTPAAWSGTHRTSDSNWSIGNSDSGNSAIDGKIDEVYYFVGDFTDTDALNLYNSEGYPTL